MAGINATFITTAIIGLVVVVVLFQFYADALPEAQDAGDSMNESNRCVATGCFFGDGVNGTQDICFNDNSVEQTNCATANTIPLSGLFSGTGIVFLIVMASLILLVVRSYFSGKN